MKDILNNLPDKTEYKNTTSRKFKSDLISFFKDKNLLVCLEIGTNHGHTTHVLSHLFEHVYTIDLHQSNIDIARKVNSDRSNINYITGDAYIASNYKNVPIIDVAFIDCMHTFEGVFTDIQTALSKCGENGIYLIFDDYAHPTSTGVYEAIEHAIDEGLKREIYIGQEQGFTFSQEVNPTTLIREEGIILSYGK